MSGGIQHEGITDGHDYAFIYPHGDVWTGTPNGLGTNYEPFEPYLKGGD